MVRVCGALVGLAFGLFSAAARAESPDEAYSWQRRLELEQPRIIRYLEGMAIPPGYERETRYDGRLLTAGALKFAGGYLMGVGATLLVERREAVNFVPCAGPFIPTSDRDRTANEHWEGSYGDGLASLLALSGCLLELYGGVQIAVALLQPRPVLVRREVTFVPELRSGRAGLNVRVAF